jgi:hypothetical protein
VIRNSWGRGLAQAFDDQPPLVFIGSGVRIDEYARLSRFCLPKHETPVRDDVRNRRRTHACRVLGVFDD